MDSLMTKKKASNFWETVRTVLYAVAIAVTIRVFAYEPFNIPSGSMKPTLLVGDYLFVSKFSYGYSRYSLPWGLPWINGRIFAEQPKRGDVVVFKLPADNTTDYIKRLVGLPGDTIQVINGILNINGEPVRRKKVRDIKQGLFSRQVTEYVETLPNGRKHLIWEQGDDEMLDNTPVYTVPPNSYFAMGDNRDSSQDSRVMSAVGFVPFVNLVGRAEFLFFSHNDSARLWEIWKWPFAIRYSRIGDGIQ